MQFTPKLKTTIPSSSQRILNRLDEEEEEEEQEQEFVQRRAPCSYKRVYFMTTSWWRVEISCRAEMFSREGQGSSIKWQEGPSLLLLVINFTNQAV